MEFSELVRELARHLQLSNLTASDGACAIRFDDIIVRFQHAPAHNAFDVSARIGSVDLRDPAVAQTLESTRDNTIALHWNDLGEVNLQQRFWLQALSFSNFFRALELFVNQVDHWRVRLKARP